MADNKVQYNKLLKWLTLILITIGLITAIGLNYQRIKVENDYMTSSIMVDYDELLRCANAQGLSFEDVARKSYKAGANGVIVRERILDDWVKSGDIIMLQGTELQMHLQSGQLLTGSEVVIDEVATYILTKNQAVYDQIFQLLEAKRRQPIQLSIGEYKVLQANLYAGELSFLGVGYPTADLQEAVDLGMIVVPRVRNWAPINQASIQVQSEALQAIPGLAGIGFNDESVPGGDNPQALEYWAEEIKELKVPLISFEFYNQNGFIALADLIDNNVTRAHAIADNELKKYNLMQAVDRFRLAAAERNIRMVYIRFFGMDQPVAALEPNLDFIKEVKKGLENEGIITGKPESLNISSLSFLSKFVLGLSVLVMGAWLLAEALANFIKKRRWLLPYLILVIIGVAIWTLALIKIPILTIKITALLAAVVFPSFAVFMTLKKDILGQRQTGSLPLAVLDLLKMSLISFAGAMIISALLRDTSFMLKLDSFVGVKLAHIIPLMLVPVALWLTERQSKKFIIDLVISPVRFWHLAVGLFILVALAIYILRTGNTGVSSVSNIELQIRQLLDTILGVRPRTKEFAIGYPFMLLLLYYGYSFKMFPLLILGLIGQISLVNTYAHLHTPLLISMYRSLTGLCLGLLIGIILVLVIKQLIKLVHKL